MRTIKLLLFVCIISLMSCSKEALVEESTSPFTTSTGCPSYFVGCGKVVNVSSGSIYTSIKVKSYCNENIIEIDSLTRRYSLGEKYCGI